jgi:hypothetical protein
MARTNRTGFFQQVQALGHLGDPSLQEGRGFFYRVAALD